MQLSYGQYQFQTNAVLIDVRLRTLLNEGNQPYATVQTFRIKGYLYTAGQADTTAQENALKTALSIPGQDLLFLDDNGNPTSEILLNVGSRTGVIVTDLHFSDEPGSPEYATLRTFDFTATAEYPRNGAATLLLSFTESLTFWGGGQIYVHRRAINGPSQRQLVWPFVEYSCTQKGTIVGYLDYPVPAPPKFPQALMKAPHITKHAPKRRGQPGAYDWFAVDYQYDFESIIPLAGVPNLWIA
jgi:hypothetical protein